MAFCRLVFPLLVLSVVSCYASEVPLYMWGVKPVSSLKSNPLQTVSEKDFEYFLKQNSIGNNDDKLTVVFVEETLSVEDFSHKNSQGKTSFPYLHSVLRNAVYLPSVKNALQALKERAGKSMTSITLYENGLSEEIPAHSETGNVIFINLKDAREGETREDLLHRHDEFMDKTVSDLKKNYDNVEAIYTAHFRSWSINEPPVTHSRTRRAVETARNNYNGNGLGLFVESIILKTSNDTQTLGNPTNHGTNVNPTNMTATFNFENSTSFVMNFNLERGYWYFGSVDLTVGTYTERLLPVNDEVYALQGFSYRCGQGVSFAAINDTRDYTLTFQNLKVQPFFEANATIQFGDSFNCVPYFSAPIWAALLVIVFMLSITFYGIMMMLDIRTMDRFDDPKGKTITINASE